VWSDLGPSKVSKHLCVRPMWRCPATAQQRSGTYGCCREEPVAALVLAGVPGPDACIWVPAPVTAGMASSRGDRAPALDALYQAGWCGGCVICMPAPAGATLGRNTVVTQQQANRMRTSAVWHGLTSGCCYW
jgi:hypothetical protein